MGITRLRLARFGSKNRPFYRIVAIDSRKARNDMPIEYVSRQRVTGSRLCCTDASNRPCTPACLQIGTYDPFPYGLDGTKEIRMRIDRIKYWLSVGAQPSDRVAYLLWRAGLMPSRPITHKPQQEMNKKARKEAAAAAKKFHTMTDAMLEAVTAAATAGVAMTGAGAAATAAAAASVPRAVASGAFSASAVVSRAAVWSPSSRPAAAGVFSGLMTRTHRLPWMR